MDELAFKYPKKVFRALIIIAMIVSIGWGVLTWNSQKAFSLWETQVTFIFEPLFNFASNRAEKLVGLAFEPFIEQMSESGNNASQEP